MSGGCSRPPMLPGPLAPGETYYGYGYYGLDSVNITQVNITSVTINRAYVNARVRNSVTVVEREVPGTGKRSHKNRGQLSRARTSR
jgi:hypothetical protein